MRDTTDSDLDPRVAAQLDKAIQLYRDLGFSGERIAAQLARSGYPPALIRERFPDLPEQLYPAPRNPRRAPKRVAVSHSSAEAVKPAAQFLPGVLAEARQLEAAAPVILQPPVDTSVPGGIAFQYVPLI